MKAVGIKNLKNELSHYLRLVKQGELVLVTDRDEVVAEIRKPTKPLLPQLSEWECFLNELEAQGHLKRATKKPTKITPDPNESPLDFDLQAFLQEERQDRF